jgi:hypothetical protein
MTETSHAADPLPADVTRKQRTKPVPPQAHSLVADVDAAFEQEILDIPQRQRKRTYIRTTSRITSGEELKRRNGLGGNALDFRLIPDRYQPPAPPATLV